MFRKKPQIDVVDAVFKDKASIVLLKPAGKVGVAMECDATRPAIDYLLIHLFAALVHKADYDKKELYELVKIGVAASKDPLFLKEEPVQDPKLTREKNKMKKDLQKFDESK